MKKRLLSLALSLALGLGLVVPAFAAEPTYTDVPESYWGFKDIEAAAEKGYMQGVGNGHFDPEGTVNVAQFLTLLGRMVFPEVSTEGTTWYGPYVEKAKTSGLLNGTQVDVNDVWAGISRYDMAVILRAAAKKLGISEKMAQQSEVNDYGVIPNMYTEAVLAVYGMGLITGDNKRNFNGSATMRRAEVATVIMRLDRVMPSGGTTTPPTESVQPTEFVPPTEVEMPTDEKMVTYECTFWVCKIDHAIGRPIDDKYTYLPSVPVKVYHTSDGGKTATLVAEVVSTSQEEHDRKGGWRFNVSFDAPESWGSKGFFVSAETTFNGERLVTSDLRTDGRAYFDWKGLAPENNKGFEIELTPPHGEKAKFTFKGHVHSDIPGHFNETLPGFVVQLHLADGQVVGEAVSGADGSFSMACEVDVLDGGFDIKEAKYYYTASGYVDGVRYENTGRNLAGNLMLKTLYQLDVCDSLGKINKYPDRNIDIYPEYRQDS